MAAHYPELIKALILGDSALSVEFLKEFSQKQKEKTIWQRNLVKTGNFDYNLEGFDETFAKYKLEKLLPLIKCPVLLIQANPELGGLVRDEDVDMALSLLPSAQHIKIDHIGHFLHLQDKEAVLKAVIPFLESLP